MSGPWNPDPSPPTPTPWTLAPRWLELEQDGFLTLEDGAPLALEETPT